MLKRIERHLVDDWRAVLRKSHSVKLAVVAPVFLEGVWAVLSSAPPELRAFISMPVFVLLAAAAVAARLWKQNNVAD
jgi:hypothetical protein